MNILIISAGLTAAYKIIRTAGHSLRTPPVLVDTDFLQSLRMPSQGSLPVDLTLNMPHQTLALHHPNSVFNRFSKNLLQLLV